MEFINRANIKKQSNNLSQSDFIRYLYQEGVRYGINHNPEFHNKIINFIKSPIGKETFQKFQSIEPSKIGINIIHILQKITE
jgi:hypothetical protein